MVERVLYAVPGRSGEAGAVRGRMCVALMLLLCCAASSNSDISRNTPRPVPGDGTGAAVMSGSGEGGEGMAGSGDSFGGELEGYGGRGESVVGGTFWRIAKRRCRR